MDVDWSEADHWRGYFECTRAITLETLVALAKGDRSRAAELVQVTHDAAVSMGNRFITSTFRFASGYAPKADIPLALMDTPANRKLAAALRAAAEAADAVAVERGLTNDQSLRGLLEMFAKSVETECYGPKKSVERDYYESK
jgi:hypothetical protein